MLPFQLQSVMGGFYPVPQSWSQPSAMEVDDETPLSAPLHQEADQMTISMMALRNKGKAKATTVDLHRQ